MDVSFQIINNCLIVKIIGELDHHSSQEIRKRIDDEIVNKNPKNIVFDMQKMSFMDSSGVGVILGRFKTIVRNGGKAAMVNVNPQVRRIYDICGLKKIIPIYDSISNTLQNM